jgi:alcohol dehydrogenase class IV
MKLAGEELLFGAGCLEHLKNIPAKRAFVVTGGSSMEKSGMLGRVVDFLGQGGAGTSVFQGVEPDPSFDTVMRGAGEMRNFSPDLIVALGGGSSMDAAKMMWVYYEHPELVTLEDVITANPFPKLRTRARLACIPSTAGTASEVSRSVVITNRGKKYGIGNMEMMPDIAICDPEVTVSMPPGITAETGMDAMTHALEALVSKRANYVSDALARRAFYDILNTLPLACHDGKNMAVRETMLNASMLAGMAFTNVSLGIVHSMAHAIGGLFHLAHGLADAVLLPYVIKFNSSDPAAKRTYDSLTDRVDRSDRVNRSDLFQTVSSLNERLGIPASFSGLIPDGDEYRARLKEASSLSLADGCTKTNPVTPTLRQLEDLLLLAYTGR